MINRGLISSRYLAIRNVHLELRDQIAQLRRLRQEVQIAELKAAKGGRDAKLHQATAPLQPQ